jgi:hypothetical protein
MATDEIVQVMAELVPDDGDALARRHGQRALAPARAIRAEILSRLEENAAYAQIWGQFQGDPAKVAPALSGILQVLLAADAALARRLEGLLDAYRQAAAPAAAAAVDTGGGAYVGGSVHTAGGDFVGRDEIIYGDRIDGDKVGGDKTTVGSISDSTGFAIGPGAQATVTQGVDGEALARLFADVYRQIEARPQDPDVDKGEMAETVQKIEQEVVKGAEANPNKVARWLRFLAGMADDILDVTVACLTHPAAGVAEVVRKVAQKAKEEAA